MIILKFAGLCTAGFRTVGVFGALVLLEVYNLTA